MNECERRIAGWSETRVRKCLSKCLRREMHSAGLRQSFGREARAWPNEQIRLCSIIRD